MVHQATPKPAQVLLQQQQAAQLAHNLSPLPLLCVQAKQRLLKEAIFKINAKHGQGTIMPMNGDALDV